ncbi:uncharacterized protein BO97DRAFT_140206 [Aspergillus homomorphus CBS 101889]|uniref:Uncharacterized protein n=1 Tax=Aspergillus homomorphus (strain CBS 101889) TaxID=1450537 RepID=A0A395HS06_ASPHC|nr:hypothetical protein BO97DRAFT_140206 [Aspergillus homomorphus CBS 101889]RAL10269.1 hypothetical protein BO97DRAFT_140206 [Aspergillus homomorphus CBS 101889]
MLYLPYDLFFFLSFLSLSVFGSDGYTFFFFRSASPSNRRWNDEHGSSVWSWTPLPRDLMGHDLIFFCLCRV